MGTGQEGKKDRKARAVELGTEDEENILCGIWRCEACLSGGMKAEKSAGSAAGARMRSAAEESGWRTAAPGGNSVGDEPSRDRIAEETVILPTGTGTGTARHGRLGPAGAKTVGCCRPAMEKDGVRWRSDLRAVDVQEATGR